MQLDSQHFGEEHSPRTFTETCVNGRSFSFGAIVPSGIVLAVLLYELYQRANLIMIMLTAFIGMNFYTMLAAVFRPPRIAIHNGWFTLRFGRTNFRCPASDVADVHREEQAVRLTLSDTGRVEPGAARQRMASVNRGSGCQIGLPAGSYTLDQINQLRAALGMPQQAADVAGEELAEFHDSVQSHRPLVTVSLIVACVIVYLAKAYHDHSLLGGTLESSITWGANYGPRTLGGQWWRLVTHLFLHAGPFHILMNMWVLWDVGRLMERLVGPMAMAMIYFLTGVAGGMASLAFHPDAVSLGASGAIFGVIGALFGLLLHARDAVPPARLRQLRSAIIAMVIFSVFFGLSVQGIDNAAHAGGAIAGLLAGLIVLPARSPGHWLRIGILAVVGAGTVLLSACLLLYAFHFVAVLQHYPEKERRILETYHDLIRQHALGELADREFADRLEADVIVPWRKLNAEVTAAMKGHIEEGQQKKFEQRMSLRQDRFEGLLAAVRDHADVRVIRALEQAEATAIAFELEGKEEKER
jgi:rhomboid protease GluP